MNREENLSTGTDTILDVRGVGKEFDGNVVLKDVSFSLRKGEILGLCGENGAGKSTLMNILFGMDVIHDTGGYNGAVLVDGDTVNFVTPMDALKAGIGMVHQEFSLIPGFSVAENILLNREPQKATLISRLAGRAGNKLESIDQISMNAKAEDALARLQVEMDVDQEVVDLPVGYKQFIEIAREISKDKASLLILDEPTAVLTESEADLLLDSMRKLADLGIGIIFITHRLREIMEVCDTVVVMRDGVVVSNRPAAATSIRQIARDMVGRTVNREGGMHEGHGSDETLLEVRNLWVDMPGETVRNASFEVKSGEIFGIAGLSGQGKVGITNGLMGLNPAGGTVTYKGRPFKLNNTNSALNSGLAFVTEDRRGTGLLLDEPISWNISFNSMQVKGTALKRIGLARFRDEKKMDEIARTFIEALDIKCTGPEQPVRELSGGNQQKVCLAQAFSLEPELLLVNEPTRGIDIGAKDLVLETLTRVNDERDTTIIIVSSELEELRSIADRIAVVSEGRIMGILSPDAPAEHFALLMSGESIEEAS